MSCVRRLSSFHSNRLHSCTATIELEENSVKHVPPDGFFGIQIFPNSVSVGTRPGDSPRLPSRMGKGTPLPTLLDAFTPSAYRPPCLTTFQNLPSLPVFCVLLYVANKLSLFSPPPTEYITQWAAVRYR